MLKGVVAALLPKDCDDFYNLGWRANGVYDVHVGRSTVQTYCEFNQDGYNWMVNIFHET